MRGEIRYQKRRSIYIHTPVSLLYSKRIPINTMNLAVRAKRLAYRLVKRKDGEGMHVWRGFEGLEGPCG